jgi:hypothetical protein
VILQPDDSIAEAARSAVEFFAGRVRIVPARFLVSSGVIEMPIKEVDGLLLLKKYSRPL